MELTSPVVRFAEQRVVRAKELVAETQREYLTLRGGWREKAEFDAASADLLDAEQQLYTLKKTARLMERSALGTVALGAGLSGIESAMFPVTGLQFRGLESALATENVVQSGLVGLEAIQALTNSLSRARADTYADSSRYSLPGASSYYSDYSAPATWPTTKDRSIDRTIRESLEVEDQWRKALALERARNETSRSGYGSSDYTGYSSRSDALPRYDLPTERSELASIRSSATMQSAGRASVNPRTTIVSSAVDKPEPRYSSLSSGTPIHPPGVAAFDSLTRATWLWCGRPVKNTTRRRASAHCKNAPANHSCRPDAASPAQFRFCRCRARQ